LYEWAYPIKIRLRETRKTSQTIGKGALKHGQRVEKRLGKRQIWGWRCTFGRTPSYIEEEPGILCYISGTLILLKPKGKIQFYRRSEDIFLV
jgi:hypothetical protein